MHEVFMRRCLDLAKLSLGYVSPNPMVGSVLVHQGKIISEGYHRTYGGPHAEVEALTPILDEHLLSESILYVSLEPCSHHGKTPPCVDLILAKKIKQVVIACRDNYHEVDGKGIERLRQEGVKVTVGVLESEAQALNKRFFTFHAKKRPYITLKWAQSKDLYMDRLRKEEDEGHINWISCPETQSLVHLWRSQEQGIMVAKNTALCDDPSLTVRRISGKNPLRIVLDSQLSLPQTLKIFQASSPTLILNLIETKQGENVKYVKLSDMSLPIILEALYKEGIQSVLVEGGNQLLQNFIDSNLWDEARVITGASLFHDGLPAPKLSAQEERRTSHFTDLITYYKPIL